MDQEARLLIIDDNVDLCHNLADIFEEQGYRTQAEHTGAQGLAALRERSFHVVLLDIRLPDGQGTELLPLIREINPDMPVIVITAYASLETAVQALHLGASGYVLKPLQVDTVLVMVRRALERLRLVQQERRLTEQLRALNRAALNITAQLDLTRVLNVVAERARALVGATCAAVQVLGRHGEIEHFVTAGLTDKELPDKVHRQALLVPLLSQTHALRPTDLPQDPRVTGWPPGHPPMTGFLGVPIVSRGRMLGGLYLANKFTEDAKPQDLPFTSEDRQVIEILAAQAAVAIENAQLYQAERQRNRELALLNQLGQELTATLDQEQVIERLLRAATRVIDAVGASVWLWEEDREGWLVCRAASVGDQQRSPVDMRLRPGQGVAGWVAQAGESVVVPDVSQDARFFSGIDEQTGMQTRSLIAVPLRARHTTIGVLEVVNKLGDEFDEDDRSLVETLAASAAIAIDNAALLETLRDRTVELKARNEELDAFSHTAAHDLQSPLALIIGYAEVLGDSDAPLDEAAEALLWKIIKSGRKMSNIIEELLLLAGLREVKKVPLRPLDMGRIVSEALESLAYLVWDNQAEIHLPEQWPSVLGQATWVEEVWVNYLSNAIKYGGRPPHIEIGATVQADDMVRFWVRDNGRGLTEAEQARLFTPFTRLDQVRARGHGLGLSIVRRIVEKLGGEVGVESKVGAGSVFSFTLPANCAKLGAHSEA